MAKAAELVYRDQVQQLQKHAVGQLNKLEQTQRENADLQLRVQNALEQNALQVEHAREQALLAELTDKKWRAKYSAREQDLLAQVAARTQEAQQAKQGAAESLRSELATLKVQSSHDALIALHEQKTAFELRAQESEQTWQRRMGDVDDDDDADHASSSRDSAQGRQQ